jgi:5'-3' exonuclease
MNKKTLLVLDWSGLMFRSLALNALYGMTGKGTNYDNMDEMKSFIYKFAIDVCSIMNIFHPNKIIIASDSANPWRKDIDLGDIGYKGTRIHNQSYNWQNIYKCANDLSSYYKDAGCSIAKVDRGEADDIMCMTKEMVFEKYHDYNIIIVSADADIRQLVDFNKLTNQYCLVYNTIAKGKTDKRMLYGTQEFLDWFNTEDSYDIFFSNVDMARKNLKDILQKNPKIEIAVDNPNEIVLTKIFAGDDGDAVPSFYNWYNNTKLHRITPLKTKKICEIAGITNVHSLLDVAQQGLLEHAIETSIKREIKDIDVNERLNRQRLLVELNSELFPEYIKGYKADIELMFEDDKQLVFPIKATSLLAGTEYNGASKRKAVEAEIFKDLAKYTNNTSNALF